MPILYKNIQAEILQNYMGDVYIFTNLSALVQFEDYINLNGFIAYLQTFKKVVNYTYLTKPKTFGLKNQYNLPTITLEISY